MMVKRITLKPTGDNDYFLIGISCHMKDYRFSFFLNKHLGFNFRRTEDFCLGSAEGKNTAYTLYTYKDPDTRVHFCLISNNHPNGKLVPELRHTDYLLLTRDVPDEDWHKELIQKIRTIPQVLLAYSIEKHLLKDIDPLLDEVELHLLTHGHQKT